jgi:hypothetical protein
MADAGLDPTIFGTSLDGYYYYRVVEPSRSRSLCNSHRGCLYFCLLLLSCERMDKLLRYLAEPRRWLGHRAAPTPKVEVAG